jgi:hypothetical protein
MKVFKYILSLPDAIKAKTNVKYTFNVCIMLCINSIKMSLYPLTHK